MLCATHWASNKNASHFRFGHARSHRYSVAAHKYCGPVMKWHIQFTENKFTVGVRKQSTTQRAQSTKHKTQNIEIGRHKELNRQIHKAPNIEYIYALCDSSISVYVSHY